MELSLNDLQHVKRTLKRTPPPKAPLSPSSGQNGAASSNTGLSSVALFRNKFEQKQTPPSKGHVGSSPCQDGGQRSEEKVMSVASAKAKFEQKSLLKSAPPWKQSTGNQCKAGSLNLDKNSNTSKGEPPRKTLPPVFRIGSAPAKPAKPDHLKFRLKKFQDKIILASGVTTAAITCKEGRLKPKINRTSSITVQPRQHDHICATKLSLHDREWPCIKRVLKLRKNIALTDQVIVRGKSDAAFCLG